MASKEGRRPSLTHRLSQQKHDIVYKAVQSHDHEQDPDAEEEGCGQKVLDSGTFQNMMALVILANAVVIGLETDVDAAQNLTYKLLNQVFVAIFLAELLFKLCMEGCLFFSPSFHDFAWNQFDLLVVALGVFDVVSTSVPSMKHEGTGGFATIFRMVRLLRILRIFRLIKHLKRLYLLAVGLVEAAKAIVWVTLLMGMVMYVCGIVLVKTIGRPPEDDPHAQFLAAHFGTIADSMITLFVLMSSANLPIYQEQEGLLDSHPALAMFLIMFITFGSFGMIGMLTGVINESMFENNELRKDEKRNEHEIMRESLGWRAAALYESLPLDSKGYAYVSDVRLISKEASEMLDASGVTMAHGDIFKFLELMDDDESGRITMKQFVQGMEKIGEGVSPLGMIELQHYICLCNKKLSHSLSRLQLVEDKLETQMERTSSEVDRILQVVLKMNGERLDGSRVSQSQHADLTSSTQRFSEELRSFEGRLVSLLATHSALVSSTLERVGDRQLDGMEQMLQSALSQKCESILSSLGMLRCSDGTTASHPALSKLDAILGSVQELARKETFRGLQAGTGSFSAGAPHLQEARNSGQQDLSLALEAQVASLEGKLLGGVAELGGVILGGTAELLCQNQVTMKSDLFTLQKELSMNRAPLPRASDDDISRFDMSRWPITVPASDVEVVHVTRP